MAYASEVLREESRKLSTELVGDSERMAGIRRLITQVAPADASVLILGESGTGKEVVARGVHNLSARSAGPFVPINCGAIPAELLESELFGHEKGAFTGASSSRQGRFELAAGGTLFLDEIGDMPLQMQVKLLRVLQEHCFERVGGNKTLDCDVRVVAATHQNLEQRVESGEFRMDLFYRLNVFPIDMPPLREHVEDIPVLIKRFVDLMERERRNSVSLSDGAMNALMRYSWPGNVRELSNLLERLAILYPNGKVQLEELPKRFVNGSSAGSTQLDILEQPTARIEVLPIADTVQVASGHEQLGGEGPVQSAPEELEMLAAEGIDLKSHLAELERSLVVQALEQHDWVVARAAKVLNLQRTTLVEKMRKYGIERPSTASES